MSRALVPALLVALAGTAARAEDFSGFYAGINAGYAAGASRDRTVAIPGAGVPAADGPRAGSDLPPSAAGAVAALRRPERGGDRAPRPR